MGPGKKELLIRWHVLSDMPAILEIEQDSFEFPWTAMDFARWSRQRHAYLFVAETGRRIVGYMAYDALPGRVQLLNVAVARGVRRQQVGTVMVEVLKRVRRGKRSCIATEVREANLPAQLFLRSLGFRATKLLGDFYADTCEDAIAIAMEYRPPDSPGHNRLQKYFDCLDRERLR